MDKFSRVKKNTEMYDKIANKNDNDTMIDDSMKDYSRRTKRVTTPLEEPVDYQANRNKTMHDSELEPFNKPTEEVLRDKDLLSEFIEEVKEYNIQRGLRKVNDTQVNILKNLGKINAQEDESKVMDDDIISFDDLEEASIFSNLKQDVIDDDSMTPDEQTLVIDEELDESLTEEIESVMQSLPDEPYGSKEFIEKTQQFDILSDDDLNSIDKDEEIENIDISKEEDILIDTAQHDNADFYDTITDEIELKNIDTDQASEILNDDHKRMQKEREDELFELTQTLSLQLHEYEDELMDVNDKVSALDKVLSIFVFVLILVLVSIIAVVVYWVLNERGIV